MSDVEDLWVTIFSYLNAEEKLKMQAVSKLFKKSVKSPSLWTKMALQNSKIKNSLIFQKEILCLREITIIGCGSLPESELVKMLDCQKQLESLYIRSFGIENTSPLVVCSTMKSLKLINCGLVDSTTQRWLNHYPNLVTLDLSDNPIEGNSLVILQENIDNLTLASTKIASAFFERLPFITNLSISQCYQVDEHVFEYLKRNSKINSLDISLNIQFSRVVLELCHHPSLRKLNLRGIKDVPREHVNRLFDTNNLEQILDPLGHWRYR